MEKIDYKYLYGIDSPADLKRLSVEQLKEYCNELRHFIVDNLSSNPGHLASSLGAVELAVAVHYLFDTPNDKLIWDVGHQAYAHKIITGRRDGFATNRKLGGLSGFPRMDESPYDAFGGGHASVSISAALGLAKAAALSGESRYVVAVIGDGAMTGGLAFEGMNNAGASRADLLVILNDNGMSIAPNVGALTQYLLRITSSKRYNRFKNWVWELLGWAPWLRNAIRQLGHAIKSSILQQSNLFESMNFRYFGPVDGNNIEQLIRVLGDLKHIKGPKLLHVVTRKGKGFAPAESGDPVWHAPGCFDPDTGELRRSGGAKPPKYQTVFGNTLLELARLDKRVVGITPAMTLGCSMDILMHAMPERCFDVGIAEGHAVTFAAGLAAGGMVPFCNVYSSFMQRAYDNIIHDVALQHLPVVLCLDRAGLVGEDGATHHGAFDLAYLSAVPGLVVGVPRNERQLRNMMFTALNAACPFAIRYPRGLGEGVELGEFRLLTIGRGEVLREGSDVALLGVGTVLTDALRAAETLEGEGVSVEVVDLGWAKPLDEELILSTGGRFKRIVTVEDGTIEGGVGSRVAALLADCGTDCRVVRLGIPDTFVEQGSVAQLKSLCHYDRAGIESALRTLAH